VLQELQELFVDLLLSLVVDPMADALQLDAVDQTGKAGAELFEWWIERPEVVRSSGHVERRLGDLGAFEGGGQMEVGFGGAVIVQCAVKACPLELADGMGHVIYVRP
jgi:hypothetical protein